jgi:hypothetical protein
LDFSFGFQRIIPEGFKSIAVGKRCGPPTDKRKKKSDPEGVTVFGLCLTLSDLFSTPPWASRQRSPTAIDLNPFGIRKHIEFNLKLKMTQYQKRIKLYLGTELW